ncbi:MAG: bifunctional diaminohydroxyphosphoribosylaminopyrimidine deaminase/5-amino-6-(5-phosphoribosylamino)uracil reductase RibD [Bergeyella zoohelcum]|nr:bifunctional diaminohydroxyphosphoribosylaminopyrimidine deaminase/5-amino-6-(5-phosphoribosylamino)uracil reductase RibD [Bergeyella zoohelcum]
MKDQIYIRRCIELAQKAQGNTYPNPMVGAVIVHNGKIIGEGYHQKAGEPHAEINAINSVKDKNLLKDSTIYVSLEPCSHFGKTPPCALKLREIGFRKVVIGATDTNEKVSGKGIKLLQEAGIETISGVLEQECRELNKRFFCFHEKKRPYIILKWAESTDGFLDKNYQPTPISNGLANQFVHQLRADEHAILVGTQTALNDNPSLTTRHISGRNPIRIVLDFDLKLPPHFNLFNHEAPTFIVNQMKNETIGQLKYIKINKENALSELMEQLYKEQIQSIIVEGGRYTLQQFIHQNLWDEAIIIKHHNLYLENGTPAPDFPFIPDNEIEIRDCTIKFFHSIIK